MLLGALRLFLRCCWPAAEAETAAAAKTHVCLIESIRGAKIKGFFHQKLLEHRLTYFTYLSIHTILLSFNLLLPLFIIIFTEIKSGISSQTLRCLVFDMFEIYFIGSGVLDGVFSFRF